MTKKRLTITLDKEILRRIDDAIDGGKIRNRSHAIEYLLRSCLIPKNTKVLILAGGQGVKFRPLTYEMPKSLLPVRGKPLLQHTLESLRGSGLRDIYISIGHLGKKIQEHFGDGKRLNLNIHYLEQSRKKEGTAQPLYEAREYFTENPFLLVYGDVLTDLNFADLLDYHRSHHGIATMALASVEKTSMWGVASIQGTRVIDFVEKPNKKTRSHLINAGIYVLDPKVFKYINKGNTRLEKDLFPRLAKEGKLFAYPFEAGWNDVSTPEIYERVLKLRQ